MIASRNEGLARELATLVNQQVDQLRKLEATLRQQQTAVIGRDVEAVLASLAEQSEVLDGLRAADDKRTGVLTLLSGGLGLEAGKATLRDLAGALGGTLGDELDSLSATGREALAIVTRVNNDNRRLIEQSLEFIETMLAAASGRAPAASTYQASGVLTRTQIETIVDHSA